MKRPAQYLSLLLSLSLIFPSCTPTPPMEEEDEFPKEARIRGAFEQEWTATHDPATGTVPRQRLQQARQVAQQLRAQSRSAAPLLWVERGPSGVGGRTRALLFDRNDPTGQTVWAGGVAGGLWKTTQIDNPDPQWQHVDDFFDNLAISCLLQHPQHPDTLYFGTGEGWFNFDAVRGLGIWRSIDGGQSWQQLPSTNQPDFYYVQALAFDTQGRLLVATREAGLLRSANGGQSWTTVLSPTAGAAPHTLAGDIELATNGDLYVTFGAYQRTGAVYRSRFDLHGPQTGNPGTWENITPAGDWERMELTSAPSNPQRLYLLAQGAGTTKVTGCFRSSDRGDSWQPTGSIPVQVGQAWYNLIARVDPLDPDRWFLGAMRLYRSSDAGDNWEQLEPIHVDHHNIVFDPFNPQRAVLGNDGGVYLCPNLTGPFPNLQERNVGYNVTQFYGGALHPDPSSDELFGGTQDNGTQRINQPGLNPEDQLLTGDGGFCYYDPQQPQLQIASIIYNRYRITTDGWQSSETTNFGFSGRFINPSDYDADTKTLFCGDEAGTYRRWTQVDQCQNAGCSEQVPVSAFGGGEVTHVRLDPHRPGQVYFGLGNGRLVRVPQAGTAAAAAGQWLNAGSAMPEGWISSIAADPLDSLHLIVTYSNYGLPSVWETLDGGQSWTDIENNLPDLPVRWADFSPGQSQTLLLATDLGVWMCEQLQGPATVWAPAGNGLANTRVDMLRFRAADGLLLAVTHGRGLFTTDFFRRPAVSFFRDSLWLEENSLPAQAGTCADSAWSVQLPVFVQPPPDEPLQVAVTISPDGTAGPGRDFHLSDTLLSFGPGMPDTQLVQISITQDQAVETTESFGLRLDWPDSLSLGPGLYPELWVQVGDDEVEVENYQQSVLDVLGEGAVGLNGMPFYNAAEDGRFQFLYRADELLGAGFELGPLQRLAFNVIDRNGFGFFQQFSLRLMNTSIGQLSSFFESGGTTVYSGSLLLQEGWNEITFDQPFLWNGQNLLVEVCYDNPPGWTSPNDFVLGSQRSYACARQALLNNSSGCSLSGPVIVANQRPDLRLLQEREIELAETPGEAREVFLDVGEKAHVLDQEGKLLATLLAQTAGCFTLQLVRGGADTLRPPAFFPEAILEKTLRIDADPSAAYHLTVYASSAEFSAWPAGFVPAYLLRLDTLPESADLQQVDFFPLADTSHFGQPKKYRFTAQVTGGGYYVLGSGLAGPLPVQGIQLQGEWAGEKVSLQWSMSGEETGVESYTLQRSDGLGSFQPIGLHPAERLGTYSRYDSPPLSVADFWYYRVQALPAGSYSNTIALPTAEPEYALFPQPAAEWVTLCLPASLLDGGEVRVVLYNARGEELRRWRQGAACAQWSLRELAAGLYFLAVEQGKKRQWASRLLVSP